MEEFMKVLMGDMAVGTMLGYVFLTLVGAGLSLLVEVNSRNVDSGSTPRGFSWRFLALDNVKRFVWVILLVYAVVRFSYMLFPGEPVDWVMVSLGYNIDSLMGSAKKGSKVVGMNRQKLMG